MNEAKTCGFCGHYLENNSHGIDQNDVYYDSTDGDYKHTGSCTYCKECNPRLKEPNTN